MESDRTPTEARGGVVSGRILTILVVSSVAAIVALGVAWMVIAQ